MPNRQVYQARICVWDPREISYREVVVHSDHKARLVDMPGLSQSNEAERGFESLTRSGFRDQSGVFWPPQAVAYMFFDGLVTVQEDPA